MMISFNWTAMALLAGRKSVTRRDWVLKHREHFNEGDVVDAWDYNPRVKGRRIGKIRILSIDYEHMSMMPDSDYEAEGFAFLQEKYGGYATSRQSFEHWRGTDEKMFVVRFEPVQLFEHLLNDDEWLSIYEKRSSKSMAKAFDPFSK